MADNNGIVIKSYIDQNGRLVTTETVGNNHMQQMAFPTAQQAAPYAPGSNIVPSGCGLPGTYDPANNNILPGGKGYKAPKASRLTFTDLRTFGDGDVVFIFTGNPFFTFPRISAEIAAAANPAATAVIEQNTEQSTINAGFNALCCDGSCPSIMITAPNVQSWSFVLAYLDGTSTLKITPYSMSEFSLPNYFQTDKVIIPSEKFQIGAPTAIGIQRNEPAVGSDTMSMIFYNC
ncbi:MAG: hypothetical protein DA328_04515 [Nitrososphaeraceae archaeon]|nr:hypothetical protein [Nitrososphaeraceae archaeon]